MDTLSSCYADRIGEMIKRSVVRKVVTEDQAYLKGNPDLVPFVDSILLDWASPSSELRHFEHVYALAALARQGKGCLILAEHYSNFDFPAVHYLVRKHGEEGRKVAETLVAIAGVKLHEASSGTSAFLEAFTRVLVCPVQAIEALRARPQTPETQAELARSVRINRAAVRHIAEAKTRGEIVLIFPTGTRYRPEKPETKRGLREIDSYLKMSDAFILMSINGNCLRVNAGGDMLEDTLHHDRVILDCSPVMSPEEFRAPILARLGPDADRKQAVADEVMARLEVMHEAAEKGRL
jgi:hypothetical protein